MDWKESNKCERAPERDRGREREKETETRRKIGKVKVPIEQPERHTCTNVYHVTENKIKIKQRETLNSFCRRQITDERENRIYVNGRKNKIMMFPKKN